MKSNGISKIEHPGAPEKIGTALNWLHENFYELLLDEAALSEDATRGDFFDLGVSVTAWEEALLSGNRDRCFHHALLLEDLLPTCLGKNASPFVAQIWRLSEIEGPVLNGLRE